ncbi:uncharacterized protein LOC107055472 isoform X1 [Gallus gallus]|uniref:uncharacterized protein LOC107055472 isoform X1 n=1 Tax=Gallus gallus TaxID=9031 RepID=UPI001F02F9BE|nr:uncharacterized protein LOC107055472 isoform X1 [Gallus gallus]
MGSYPGFGQVIHSDRSAHQEDTSATREHSVSGKLNSIRQHRQGRGWSCTRGTMFSYSFIPEKCTELPPLPKQGMCSSHRFQSQYRALSQALSH